MCTLCERHHFVSGCVYTFVNGKALPRIEPREQWLAGPCRRELVWACCGGVRGVSRDAPAQQTAASNAARRWQHVESTITDEEGSGGSTTTGMCFKGLVGMNQDRFFLVFVCACVSGL